MYIGSNYNQLGFSATLQSFTYPDHFHSSQTMSKLLNYLLTAEPISISYQKATLEDDGKGKRGTRILPQHQDHN